MGVVGRDQLRAEGASTPIAALRLPRQSAGTEGAKRPDQRPGQSKARARPGSEQCQRRR